MLTRRQTPKQIFLVGKDRQIADEIGTTLDRLGYRIHRAAAFADGPDTAGASAIIMVLDRAAQGADGALAIGTSPQLFADDLAKPSAMDELAARVEVLLRRLDDRRATRLRVGALEMDLIERVVTRDDTAIQLMPLQFKLLEYFLRRPGQVITRAMLLEGIWRYRCAVETNVVDVHIGALRRKIDVAGRPSLIRSIRGAGFMLDAAD